MSPAQQTARSPDSTPLFTRIALIVTLAITGLALVALQQPAGAPAEREHVVFLLWLFTVLFVLRVAGQVLVALGPRRWLPPMEQWNLIPYPILLPIQIVFIVVMIWIDIDFARDSGVASAALPGLGAFLIVFSAVYALSMAARYIVRMSRRPDQRWYGGAIPIVFHFVLAAYLYVLGNVYAS